MNRCLAFAFALLFSIATVTSAVAQPGDWLHFTLEPSRNHDGQIHASFRDERNPGRHQWSTSFPASELRGLDVAGFRASGSRALNFAVVREAGRVDCAGHGGESYAAGNCRYTSDPLFVQALARHGLGRPDDDDAMALIAIDAHVALLDALQQARYPTPDLDKFIELSAVGVTPAYISDLAGQGYRPVSLDKLVEFRALDITPQFIASFQRAGYRNLDPDDLVQLRALDITPDYIASFNRIGYRDLPVDMLVQLKALDVTPQYVQDVVKSGLAEHPSLDQLVQFKALSFDPGKRRRR